MKRAHLFIVTAVIFCLGVGGTFAAEGDETDQPQGILNLPEQLSVEYTLPPNEKMVMAGEGQVHLPYGDYHLKKWSIERKDEQGSTWKLVGYGGPVKSFKIGKEPFRLDIVPEPITASASIRYAKDSYYFSINLTGCANEKISLFQDGKRAKAPVLEITNADKSFNVTLDSSYG